MMTLTRLKDQYTGSPGNTYRMTSILTGGEIFSLINSLKKHDTEVAKDLIAKLKVAIKNCGDNDDLQALLKDPV
jgi:hypothetical protein